MQSGSGPEATIHCFSFQLGMSLTEIGPLYDRPNESVILRVENAAPYVFDAETEHVARRCGGWNRRGKALAAAAVRRDHEWMVKLP
jgi:hypothetical protein